MPIEDKNYRRNRLMRGSYVESVESLINSMDNFLNNEIEIAAQNNLWNLAILGVHAACCTLSMAFYAKDDEEGLKMFLEVFVDQKEPGFNFSNIAGELKEYREVIAHRWYSERGYGIGTDETMKEGWRNKNGIIFVNRKLYIATYLAAFQSGGSIWEYERVINGKESEVKKRMIKRYSSVKSNKKKKSK